MSAATPTRGGMTGERTLSEAALARLEGRQALAVMAAVDELLARAARVAGRVSQPRPDTAGLERKTEGAPAGRLVEVGPAPPAIFSEVA